MLGLSTLIRSAWRPSTLDVGHVQVIPADFGTHGSLADTRRRQSYTILTPPEPRLRLFNGLFPVVWRFRETDAAKVAAVGAMAPQTYGRSMQFTDPRTASLTTPGRLPR